MFAWRQRVNLDPYFRAVYWLQLVAVVCVTAGLFLTWWEGGTLADTLADPDAEIEEGPRHLNGFDLLGRSVDKLTDRNPNVIVEPMLLLWLLVPLILLEGGRSFAGTFVTPVAWPRIAVLSWGAALLALVHFYANFGRDLDPLSPLQNGSVQVGFWLTSSSTVLLGLLVLTEFVIKAPAPDPFLSHAARTGNPVDDAERIWRGDYLTCPHCGMLNEPQSRRCYHCQNLLFNFSDERE